MWKNWEISWIWILFFLFDRATLLPSFILHICEQILNSINHFYQMYIRINFFLSSISLEQTPWIRIAKQEQWNLNLTNISISCKQRTTKQASKSRKMEEEIKSNEIRTLCFILYLDIFIPPFAQPINILCYEMSKICHHLRKLLLFTQRDKTKQNKKKSGETKYKWNSRTPIKLKHFEYHKIFYNLQSNETFLSLSSKGKRFSVFLLLLSLLSNFNFFFLSSSWSSHKINKKKKKKKTKSANISALIQVTTNQNFISKRIVFNLYTNPIFLPVIIVRGKKQMLVIIFLSQ